jgi:alpha-glucosidase
MQIDYVSVSDFTPNLSRWTPVGAISATAISGNVVTLTLAEQRRIQLSFLSDRCFRMRFDPNPAADYAEDYSPAVVETDLGTLALAVTQDDANLLVIETGAMRVEIGKQPYRLSVFRGQQLICADEPVYNLVYIPGQRVVANFKRRPDNALYCGFGEKAGTQLFKNLFSLTQFNYNNYLYSLATVPHGTEAGPLNPSVALYASIPFMIETNPAPTGDFAGAPYSYGLFLDNPSQSFFNMGSNGYYDQPSDMSGKYYLGALFNELNSYFFLGDNVPDILGQYTRLTGRGAMPPLYTLGYHQGAYGYYDRAVLEHAADQMRAARIPCDGLHIDVDLQNNYRTFTHSEMKFPNCHQMLDQLRNRGFRCSTNITAIITDRGLDENAQYTPYDQRDALLTAGALIYDTYAGQGPSPKLFTGAVGYGVNHKTNPYASPGNPPNANGDTPLGTSGNYPDFGREDVRDVWGEQYRHLIVDLGLDMIWQDMMCPALSDAFSNQTFPLTLMTHNGADYVPHGVMHNSYGMLLLQATYEGMSRLRPDQRSFIIARGGYAGMQRYAALWTGDSASSWDFLAINLPEVLNLGLSGVPHSGCDIGGFGPGSGSRGQQSFANGQVYGNITDYELLTRWMHLGSFLPWYRNHYYGYEKQFQEPYRYGDPVPANCRKYVELRYRMLQLYYDAFWEWTQTGMPIARALFLNDPDDTAVYGHCDDQFFVGQDLLVAPITSPGNGSPPVAIRSVYLPTGSKWYAFKDGGKLDAPVPGGTFIPAWYAALDQVPIYVREGGIIPMRGLQQWVGELRDNPLDIHIYPGKAGSHVLYLDDGESTQAEKSQAYRTSKITHTPKAGGGHTIGIVRTHDRFTPVEDHFRLTLWGRSAPASLIANGAALAHSPDAAAFDHQAGDCYYVDRELEAVRIKLMDNRAAITVELN